MFRPVSALRRLRRRALRGRPRLRPRSRLTNKLLLVLAALGPGLIAANAGNDAGGIATYASVGAKYGYDLLWMMVVITVSLIVVQEMAARMGAVTGKGLAELIREQYGVRWSAFATVSVLIANLGICISEFVGIGAALSLAHVPEVRVDPDRRGVRLAPARAGLLQARGADLRADDDPVLRLPGRGDPREAELGSTSDTRSWHLTFNSIPATSSCSSQQPARRSRRSCSSTSNQPSSRRESGRNS